MPLALLLRTAALDRATVRATTDAQSLAPVVGAADPETVRLTVEQLAAEYDRPVSVFLPDGAVLGSRARVRQRWNWPGGDRASPRSRPRAGRW